MNGFALTTDTVALSIDSAALSVVGAPLSIGNSNSHAFLGNLRCWN